MVFYQLLLLVAAPINNIIHTKEVIMSGSKPIHNPYQKRAPLGAHNDNKMGRQSQQRVSNTKRAYGLATPKKPKTTTQLTLQGEIAFVAERDCNTCKTQSLAKQIPG